MKLTRMLAAGALVVGGTAVPVLAGATPALAATPDAPCHVHISTDVYTGIYGHSRVGWDFDGTVGPDGNTCDTGLAGMSLPLPLLKVVQPGTACGSTTNLTFRVINGVSENAAITTSCPQ